MNKATSAYLDAWRILAAVAVVLHHLNDWSGKGIPFFSPAIGAQGVIVFFVLSGFVISYVINGRELHWRTYAVARLSRIYSVALPAMVLTFLIDRVCPPLPHWRMDDSAIHDASLTFLAGLTFLNEVWSHHVVIGSNVPYWSMGYEVPFYLVFGLACFLPRNWKFLSLLAVAFYGPRIAVLGLIWLLGVGVQTVCHRRWLGRRPGMALLLLSAAGWIGFNDLVGRNIVTWTDAPLFWHKLNDLPADFLVAGLFGASIAGLDAAFRDLPVAPKFKVSLQWTAGGTFALYLFHVPVARALLSIAPGKLHTADGKALIFTGIVAASFLLAELTERRKAWWKALFCRIIPEPGPIPGGVPAS